METPVVETGLEAITSAASELPTLMENLWDVIVANPMLCVFLALSLFGVGVCVYKKAKGAARG